ncbi:MAG: alpha-E domain-containing protein [Gammaproteobacteria bacterium]
MLSRTAERLYWIGRYMERAENNGRMVSAVTEMILGSPKEAKALWTVVVEVMGLKAAYVERYGAVDERHVVRMLAGRRVGAVIDLLFGDARARKRPHYPRNSSHRGLGTHQRQLLACEGACRARRHAQSSQRLSTTRVIERCQLFNGMLAAP